MQLEDLFNHFFEVEKETIPYDLVEEYEMDRIRLLDIILNVACSMKYLTGEGEMPIEIENAHLRGIAITGSEVIESLQANALTYENAIPVKKISNIISKAVEHIEARVSISTITIPTRQLEKRIGLSPFEQFLFLLAYANYTDSKYELLYAYLQGDVRMKLPSLRMAVSLYELFDTIDKKEIAGLAEGQGKIFDILLQTCELYDNIKLAQTYTLQDGVYGWVSGKEEISRRLEGIAELYHKEEIKDNIIIRHDKIETLQKLCCEMMKLDGSKKVLNLYGKRGMGKRFMMKQSMKMLNQSVLFVIMAEVLKHSEQEEWITRIYRECILKNAVLCIIDTDNQKREEEREYAVMQQVIRNIKRRFSFFLWLSEEKAEYLLGQDLKYTALEVPNLSMKERHLLWSEYAKRYLIDEQIDFRLLSNQFILSIREIQDALWNADVCRKSEHREMIDAQDIKHAIKQQSVSHLGSCANLIPAVYTWDALVLPEENIRQLKMICEQVKYKSIVGEEWGFYEKTAYGRGICALFFGAPGTGKTMAVQVIANELGLNVYRIDLSQLVSKYIGETEKNISKVFECAKGINAILFFDEADSLFTKRTDVHDSLDRSANAQTAHLLQQIENYDGITILATNLAMNIDDAFKRRIKFMVKFSFPSEEERLKLWRTILPDRVPCEERLELEFFAKNFELSGSSIKEVLTNAAFFAVAEKRKLSNRDLVEAIKLNFSKYGKTLSNEEFEYLV